MQFTINRNLFLENLNNAMRAISSRATIPILSGIKLTLTDEMLTLPGNFFTISLKNRAGKTIDPVDWTIKSSFTGI